MIRPAWYTAPGVERPAHVPPVGLACVPDVEPAPGMPPGGHFWGCAPEPDGQRVWEPCGPGVWHLAPPNPSPAAYLRIDAIAGWRWEGWALPELMDPDGLLVVPCTHRLGADGHWTTEPPAGLADIVRELREVMHLSPLAIVHRPGGLGLIARIIGINYALGDHELSARGWMTTPLALAALKSAIGIDPQRDVVPA